MVEITVGYVAGAIAAAIFLARFWSPNVLTFILSGILRESNSAATWTAASSALQRSHWSWILQSDSARNNGVRKDILSLTWFITFMSFLIAIAGVITPLGLYETLVTIEKISTPFIYVRDSSSFAYGTPPRSNFTFNRRCSGLSFYTPCPFTDTVAVVKSDARSDNTSYPYGYQITIPDVLEKAFSSGTDDSTTTSNYFDIEWRRYQLTYGDGTDFINNGSMYLVGATRAMESLVLTDTYSIIEGLIVDTRSGGIGFRNHTIPAGFKYGVSWSEDHLFIEPETECENTNLTIDFEVLQKTSDVGIGNVALVDRGGFALLSKETPKVDLRNIQSSPSLRERAYKAAWTHNTLTAMVYNVTNPHNSSTGEEAFEYLKSKIGNKFFLQNMGKSGFYDSLTISDRWATYLPIENPIGNNLQQIDLPRQSNPFGIKRSNYSDINGICSGAGRRDFANITNIHVRCGLMRGIPRRMDGGSSILFDIGSVWSQPLFACASAVKATVKTVHFTHNGTGGLKDLKVDDIKAKEYSSDASKPLWGVENYGDRFYNYAIRLLWGLIDSKYLNHPNISTVRQESLYLPGYYVGFEDESPNIAAADDQNIPASTFYMDALETAYNVLDIREQSSVGSSPADYSGVLNMAQWALWQNLTTRDDTVHKIPNLIFTDYSAAAVVGTKGIRGRRNEATKNVIPVLVCPTERRIRYRWPFAVPAIATLLALAAMTTVALIALIFHRHNMRVLRLQLQSLSPGRIFTTFLHPNLGGMTVPSSEWSKTTGKTIINVTGDFPSSTGATSLQNNGIGRSEKALNAFEASVSEGSTERDQFLGHSSSPPIPQPYVGMRQSYLVPPSPQNNRMMT